MEQSYPLATSARRTAIALVAAFFVVTTVTPLLARDSRTRASAANDAQPQEAQAKPTPIPTPAPAPVPTPMQMNMPGMEQLQMDQMRMPAAQDSAATQPQSVTPQGPVMRLEELEALATQNNPTLAQSEAAIRAAQGRMRQAGLFPNPIVGYQGNELAVRELSAGFTASAEHLIFAEQRIPLGGKLSKSRRVFAQEVTQAQALAEAQRLRVLNSLRILYYEALGAQRLVELRGGLVRLARDAVRVSAELYNVGQADRPDQLEVEIEAQRIEADLLQSQNDWEQVWRALAAMAGKPDLQPARLDGSLEEGAAALNQDELLSALLRDSPEVKAATAGVERARAALARARAERVPDLFLRGGFGYNNERLSGRKVGTEGFIEAGVTLPVFNRNQGGIAAAEAELGIAEREVQRLQLNLRTRFASSFRSYRNSLLLIEKYRTQIIPRADAAYRMYLTSFREMSASAPQVLIAQRTLFQTEIEYARALINLRRNLVGLRGLLLTGGLNPLLTPREQPNAPTEEEEFRITPDNPANGNPQDR